MLKKLEKRIKRSIFFQGVFFGYMVFSMVPFLVSKQDNDFWAGAVLVNALLMVISFLVEKNAEAKMNNHNNRNISA